MPLIGAGETGPLQVSAGGVEKKHLPNVVAPSNLRAV